MVIAMDGITVIVNNNNPINELTSEQVKNIFTGNSTNWDDINTIEYPIAYLKHLAAYAAVTKWNCCIKAKS